jgi:hypothetical protein
MALRAYVFIAGYRVGECAIEFPPHAVMPDGSERVAHPGDLVRIAIFDDDAPSLVWLTPSAPLEELPD